MMKVKIIKNTTTELLERDINEFLATIGNIRGSTVTLKDIKFAIRPETTYVALIIYNIVNGVRA